MESVVGKLFDIDQHSYQLLDEAKQYHEKSIREIGAEKAALEAHYKERTLTWKMSDTPAVRRHRWLDQLFACTLKAYFDAKRFTRYALIGEYIVKLIGADVLPNDQKLTLEIARVIRVGFLQKNTFHKDATYLPLVNQ